MIVESNVIVVGSFSKVETNALVKVEEVLVGGVSEGATIKVTDLGKNPFYTPSAILRMLNGKRFLVLGKKDSEGLSLPYGLSSLLPYNGAHIKCLNDIDPCKIIVKNILKYKQNFNKKEFPECITDDLSTSYGRVAISAFLSEDIKIWNGKESFRREIGCVVAMYLLKSNIFDEDGIAFFRSGMSSLPMSLKLIYLYQGYVDDGEYKNRCKDGLLSLLKTMGHQNATVTPEIINSGVKRFSPRDMKKCLEMLQSESAIIRQNARIMLSTISGQKAPKDMKHKDEVLFWEKIIKEIEDITENCK